MNWKIYRIGLRFPWVILIFALGLAAFSFHWVQKLKLETDFSDLLPPQTESVQNLQELKDNFGSRGYLVLTIEAEDADQSKNFAKIFSKEIENLDSVRYVDYQPPLEFFQDRQWLYLEIDDLKEMENRIERSLELEEQGVSAVFNNLMDFADKENRPDLTFKDIQEKYQKKFNRSFSDFPSNEKDNFQIIKVRAHQGAQDFEANEALISQISFLEKNLKKQTRFKEIRVGYTGDYKISLESVALLRKEISWVTSLVLILLIFILVAYFRRASSAFLVGLPLIIGVIWTGGLIYLFLGRLNIVTGFAVSILAGLGSDYGIYLLSRYFKEREGGKGFKEACELAFGKTGRATLIAMLTTVGAFGALLLSTFDVFYELGVVGFVGLLFNFLSMMLVLPSLLALGERYKKWYGSRLISWYPKREPKWSWPHSWARNLFQVSAPKLSLLLIAILIIPSLWALPIIKNIHFEDGQINNEKLPSHQLYERVSQKLGETLIPTVLVVKGEANEKRTVSELQNKLDHKQNDALVYNKVLGISSLIPPSQAEKREILSRMADKYKRLRLVNESRKRKTLESWNNTLKNQNITRKNLPTEIKRNFESPGDSEVLAVYLYPSIGRWDSKGMEKYYEGISEAKAAVGVDIKPVDSSFIYLDIVQLLNREAPRGFLMILLFFTCVLFLNLRDWKRTLLILGNLTASLILLSGILYLTGIRLNIFNLVTFPIIIGTGIDCFIHFNQRLNETKDLEDAIQTETPPILISNLTSIVGFGGFIFTSSAGLRSIGWLSVLGIVMMTLFCTLVFPRCLALLRQDRVKTLKLEQGPLGA